MSNQVSLVFLAAALALDPALVPGVHGQESVTGPLETAATAATANRRVISLDPLLSFEELPTAQGASYGSRVAVIAGVLRRGSAAAGPGSGLDAYAVALRSKASEALTAQGLTVVEPGRTPGPTLPDASGALAETLKQLQSQSGKLARGIVAGAATEQLRQVAASCGDCLIIVQYVKGQAGPGGSWNPSTGAITTAMNSLLLQAALLSSNGGQTVWKNEVFLRSLPGAGDKKFLAAVQLLFDNLKVK